MKKVVTLSLLIVLAVAGVLAATWLAEEVDPLLSAPVEATDAVMSARAIEGAAPAVAVEGGTQERVRSDKDSSTERPLWQLDVYVCDVRGRPVAGAEVGAKFGRLVQVAPRRSSAWPPPVSFTSMGQVLRSDTRGCCTLSVVGEVCKVAARLVDGRTSDVVMVDAEHAPRGPVVLQLLSEAQVHGIVLGDGDQPVVGAEVRASRSPGSTQHVRPGGWSQMTFSIDGQPTKPAEPPDLIDDVQALSYQRVQTGEDGRFLLSARRGASLSISAGIGSRGSSSCSVVVPIDDEPEFVELRLRGSLVLEGVVLDDLGDPVFDVIVRACRDGVRDESLGTGTFCGRFRFELPDYGDYVLFASGSRYGNSGRIPLRVEPGVPLPKVELRMRPIATLSGRVVDGEGQPIAGVELQARADVAEVPEQSRIGQHRHDENGTRTRADGTFSLRLDPSPSFTLMATGSHGGRAVVTGVPPGSADLRIVLAPHCGTVRGVVVRADGESVGGFGVRLLVGSAALCIPDEVHTTLDGDRFSVPMTTVGGEFWIEVTPHSRDLAPASLGPFVADGKDREVEVVLQRWGELPVQVVDRSGWPVLGALVWLAVEPNTHGESPIATDLDGRATLPKCPPGPMRIAAERFGVRAPGATVQVVPGPNPELRIQLR